MNVASMSPPCTNYENVRILSNNSLVKEEERKKERKKVKSETRRYKFEKNRE